MTTFTMLAANVCMFSLLMIPGWILGKRGRIQESAMLTLSNLLTDVAMPALVLGKLLEVDPAQLRLNALLLCLLFPLITVPAGCLVTRVCFFRGAERDTRAASRFCSVFSNCGFLGIPMASVLFPNTPEVAVYVSLFNVLSTFLLLTVGVSILSGGARRHDWKRILLTPVTACVVLGGIVLAAGLGKYCTPIVTYTSYFSLLTLPLSMLVLGYELSKLTAKEIFACKYLYPAALVKLIASPLLAMGVLLALRALGMQIGEELAVAMLLSTGVSTAASAPAMAKKYGADAPCAAILTLGTTLLCTVSLPLIWLLFQKLF